MQEGWVWEELENGNESIFKKTGTVVENGIGVVTLFVFPGEENISIQPTLLGLKLTLCCILTFYSAKHAISKTRKLHIPLA